MEEYMVICLACLIKLYAFDISNFYEILSSVFACLLFVLTLAFPLVVIGFLLKKYRADNLNTDKFRQKWGSLILDL